jgi:hypothetical protein
MSSDRDAIDFAGFPDAGSDEPLVHRTDTPKRPEQSAASQHTSTEIPAKTTPKSEANGTGVAVILIAIIIIIFIGFSQSAPDKKPTAPRSSAAQLTSAPPVARQTNTPPVAQQPAVPAVSPQSESSRLLEEPPARGVVSSGRTQLRWCLFWRARIDYLAEMIVDEPMFGPYNATVADFNNRCSELRPYERDITIVQRELEERKGQISSEAESLYRSWARTYLIPATLEVQQHLHAIGYNPGPVDGMIGSQTRDAILQLERDLGEEPTGIISKGLVDYLSRKAAH